MNSTDATPSLYRRPGRPGVTQADVDRAAEALLRAGTRPSVEKIRAQINGSPNTIAPLLDAWWARLAARVQAAPGAFERLPREFAHAAEGLFLQLIDAARARAQTEVSAAREANQREQQRHELRSYTLTLREQELNEQLKRHEARIVALESQLQEQRILTATQVAHREALEARAQRLQRELDRLQRRMTVVPAVSVATPAAPRERTSTRRRSAVKTKGTTKKSAKARRARTRPK